MDLKHWLRQRYPRWLPYLPARLSYHPDFFRVLRLLEAPVEHRRDIIDRRLRHILATAVRHVPFYRQTVRLTDRELAHEPAQALLARFPYVDKFTVMECRHAFLDERLDPRWLYPAYSSGSSGQGICMWRNKRLADVEKAFYVHQWGRLGFSFRRSRILRIGADAVCRADEPPTRTVGNRLLLSPNHLSAEHKPAILAALNRFRPEYLHGYPSSVAVLADMLQPDDLAFSLRAVLLASEPILAHQAHVIRRRFGCPISISYGLTERTNLAFADWSDARGSPYRFEPLYGVTENRTEDGQAEIVGTSLWNDVMPLIRYRTGDFGVIDERGICVSLDGRGQDFLLDRHGQRMPGTSVMIEQATWDYVRTYQVKQDRPGQLTLVVVPRHGPLTPQQRLRLLDCQRQALGAQFDIVLEEAEHLPVQASGKRRFVLASADPLVDSTTGTPG
jgi:phenylacetate-CoA ligase